jgi:hypothetical protein
MKNILHQSKQLTLKSMKWTPVIVAIFGGLSAQASNTFDDVYHVKVDALPEVFPKTTIFDQFGSDINRYTMDACKNTTSCDVFVANSDTLQGYLILSVYNDSSATFVPMNADLLVNRLDYKPSGYWNKISPELMLLKNPTPNRGYMEKYFYVSDHGLYDIDQITDGTPNLLPVWTHVAKTVRNTPTITLTMPTATPMNIPALGLTPAMGIRSLFLLACDDPLVATCDIYVTKDPKPEQIGYLVVSSYYDNPHLQTTASEQASTTVTGKAKIYASSTDKGVVATTYDLNDWNLVGSLSYLHDTAKTVSALSAKAMTSNED